MLTRRISNMFILAFGAELSYFKKKKKRIFRESLAESGREKKRVVLYYCSTLSTDGPHFEDLRVLIFPNLVSY